MKIKKTVGKPGIEGNRKDYAIHTTCGHKFYAKAIGSQGYECGGVNFDTLRAIKAHIEAGGFEDGSSVQPSETSTADGEDTWDCVHPCALLIQSINPKWPVPENCRETLGNYGWLDVMGRPDIARAEREIKRVKNLKLNKESSQDTEPSGE